jgi:hypothetical protein
MLLLKNTIKERLLECETRVPFNKEDLRCSEFELS